MLMDAGPHERLAFIASIMQDVEPAYRVTQEGDPEAQEWWLQRLPLIYVQHMRADREQGDVPKPRLS